MSAPSKVLELIEHFERNADVFHSPGLYNETQVRREFIDPLFECLGWDIANRQGIAEAYKEVIHEDAIKIGAFTKAPDYCFRVAVTRKFFVEAKKPAVNIKDDPHSAFQLRRYAWSAKLPLSILTNFEQFAVYDCRIKPARTDKASVARILYFTYKEYPDCWDEIAGIFSKTAVWAGSFDKFAESKKSKRGIATVDAAFLEEIEGWREQLARNLALRNPRLGQRDLNYAVQVTIDRIIFLRMCEDRGIEQYGQLMALQNGSAVYGRLKQLFRSADDRYNSGLFYFHPEKDRSEPPDELTPALTFDDKVLKDIIQGLYPPDSPYEFSALPAEILGHVYEQFLGKVIRLTASHQAKVEDKPEVKKAGGVYYTPAYIVDYIVKHTVGKLLEDKTPKQAEKLRILDPACGSGSFLIGAYQYLLDWYRDRYMESLRVKPGGTPEHTKVLYQTPGGWRLTTAERKRILLKNIYGVDIDPQAVEVTKLSLLLKVLEGESQETLERQRRMFHERALPDLASNIKCGNSLIGREFFNGHQLSLFDEEERFKINVFDWESEFPAIMGAGGFDAVIGNPPYVRIQTLREWAPLEVDHFKQHYKAAAKGNYDIYVVFLERGLQLLNQEGHLGFILPHKFFNAQYGQPLRELLAAGRHLAGIVHFGHEQVFAGATTYTCLMFLDKGGSDSCRFIRVDNLTDWAGNGGAVDGKIPVSAITAGDWNFSVGNGAALFEKLSKLPVKLKGWAEKMAQGIRTSANEVYVLDVISATKNVVTAYSSQLDRNVKLERTLTAPFLQGREIKPYRILPYGKVIIIPYRMESGRAVLIDDDQMRSQYPKIMEYFLENRKYLESRERGRMRGRYWYGFVYPKNIEVMRSSKILIPDIADHASFALDESGEYAFTSGYAVTLKSGVKESAKYVLGLLNSALLDFYLKRISTPMRGGFVRYFTQYIEQLPMRQIDFADRADKARHEHMVSLVEQMLSLHQQLAAANTAHDKTVLQRQIDATDGQIDRLVYALYGLTEEEIRIVEGTAP